MSEKQKAFGLAKVSTRSEYCTGVTRSHKYMTIEDLKHGVIFTRPDKPELSCQLRMKVQAPSGTSEALQERYCVALDGDQPGSVYFMSAVSPVVPVQTTIVIEDQ